ncbi:acyl carrier protein [Pelagibacteraceae bacterium]|jgi:acyl carrier protein|nr:acyl carrier protein [Pelagibacteraceae bacterium]|tara:strand:+ start:21632 stop:21871 length:240 start_codon:yes stop_codon:yes gene_type:complete
MESKKNIDLIKKSFMESINLKKKTAFEKLKYGSLGWDSVAHMQLIASLEKKFKIAIDVEDVVDMSSFKKAITILKKYIK